MNSRDRVVLSLAHKEPDRIPIDIGAMRSTGIMAIAYNRLKRYLKIEEAETRVYDICQGLAEPEEKILDLFMVDVIDLDRTLPPAVPSDIDWQTWVLQDGSNGKIPKSFRAGVGNLAISPSNQSEGNIELKSDGRGGWVLQEHNLIRLAKPRTSLYFDDVYHPLEKAESRKDVDAFFEGSNNPLVSYPPLLSKDSVKSVRRKAKHLYENTDYAIMGGFGASFFEALENLRGYNNFLIDIVKKRDFTIYLEEKLLDYFKRNLRVWLDATRDYVQIIVFVDDLGHQGGPIISPKTYREIVQPYQRELCQYVKRNSKMFVFLHSCGSIYSLLPDIIDTGIDIINPVQVSAKDMDPTRLKKEFGDDLTFWGGGVDTQRVLGNGSPEDVSKNVIANIRAFAPGGGYIFAAVHNIQANVPPENIVSTFGSVKKYGKYPLQIQEIDSVLRSR